VSGSFAAVGDLRRVAASTIFLLVAIMMRLPVHDIVLDGFWIHIL
jgi:hypothetical protein